MIEPDGVLDGDHGETVAVWFGVGHGQSDYPDPIKATQPSAALATAGVLNPYLECKAVMSASTLMIARRDCLISSCRLSTSASRSAVRADVGKMVCVIA